MMAMFRRSSRRSSIARWQTLWGGGRAMATHHHTPSENDRSRADGSKDSAILFLQKSRWLESGRRRSLADRDRFVGQRLDRLGHPVETQKNGKSSCQFLSGQVIDDTVIGPERY